MNGNKLSKTQILTAISAVLVIAALILTVISSNTAYALNHLITVIVGCVAAAVLYALVTAFGGKLPVWVRDVLLLVAVFLTSMAMCALISGRTLLAGYIYFSDLEASNPIAIAAMNLAIAAIVAYLVAIVLTVIVGFSKQEKN